MIARIEGVVVFKKQRSLIVDVGGVGYEIYTAGNVSLELGKTIELWTYQNVRENSVELFGFSHMAEREFFEHLISISGVGPRSALGVMSLASVDTLKKAIAAGDTSYLTKVSGIGKKMAEKIILELKDKLGTDFVAISDTGLQDETDILEALLSLGYSNRDARESLTKIPANISGRDARLRWILKEVGK
jgi:holliday junction DNA helicase RuvA